MSSHQFRAAAVVRASLRVLDSTPKHWSQLHAVGGKEGGMWAAVCDSRFHWWSRYWDNPIKHARLNAITATEPCMRNRVPIAHAGLSAGGCVACVQEVVCGGWTSVKLLRRIMERCPEVPMPDPWFPADDLRIKQWMATTVCITLKAVQ